MQTRPTRPAETTPSARHQDDVRSSAPAGTSPAATAPADAFEPAKPPAKLGGFLSQIAALAGPLELHERLQAAERALPPNPELSDGRRRILKGAVLGAYGSEAKGAMQSLLQSPGYRALDAASQAALLEGLRPTGLSGAAAEAVLVAPQRVLQPGAWEAARRITEDSLKVTSASAEAFVAAPGVAGAAPEDRRKLIDLWSAAPAHRARLRELVDGGAIFADDGAGRPLDRLAQLKAPSIELMQAIEASGR